MAPEAKRPYLWYPKRPLQPEVLDTIILGTNKLPSPVPLTAYLGRIMFEEQFELRSKYEKSGLEDLSTEENIAGFVEVVDILQDDYSEQAVRLKKIDPSKYTLLQAHYVKLNKLHPTHVELNNGFLLGMLRYLSIRKQALESGARSDYSHSELDVTNFFRKSIDHARQAKIDHDFDRAMVLSSRFQIQEML